jgi:Cu/Ag efflux pump CusA
MVAGGAGAEIRHALGTTVFAGMLGVTIFGLLLTPVFYVLVRRVSHHDKAPVTSEKIERIAPPTAEANHA